MKKILIILTFLISFNSFGSENTIVVGNNVSLRIFPDLNSRIIKVLNKGDQITIIKKTNFTQKINNKKDYWFHIISEKKEGWIFGAFIDKTKFDLLKIEELEENEYRILKMETFIYHPIDLSKIKTKEDLIKKYGNPLKTNVKEVKNLHNESIDKLYTIIYTNYEFSLLHVVKGNYYMIRDIHLKKKSLEILWDLDIGKAKTDIIKYLGEPETHSQINKLYYTVNYGGVEFIIENDKIIQINWDYFEG